MEIASGQRLSFDNLDYVTAFIDKALDALPSDGAFALAATSSIEELGDTDDEEDDVEEDD